MRIIAGIHRGRALTSVGRGDSGAHLRPTTDRVRESLFNVLAHQDVLDNAQVLDLFAGTGALGLEALSRGAAHVRFVENGRVAQGLLQKNIALLKAQGDTTMIRRDATRLGPCPGQPADLVFLDPPYGKALGEKALSAAVDQGWIADGALIVWEEQGAMDVPPGFTLHDTRSYGGTTMTLMWKDADPA